MLKKKDTYVKESTLPKIEMILNREKHDKDFCIVLLKDSLKYFLFCFFVLKAHLLYPQKRMITPRRKEIHCIYLIMDLHYHITNLHVI